MASSLLKRAFRVALATHVLMGCSANKRPCAIAQDLRSICSKATHVPMEQRIRSCEENNTSTTLHVSLKYRIQLCNSGIMV